MQRIRGLLPDALPERRKPVMPVHPRDVPPLTRRTVLTGTGVAVALGAVFLGAPPAHTPLVNRPSDLRDRWTEIITARARLDPTDLRVRHHMARNDSDVRAFVRSMDSSENGSVFSDYELDGENSSALSGTATRLAAMARSWVTPASQWSSHDGLRERILSGTDTLVANGYHADARPYGNWWDWEIGTPRALADTMCIMRHELPESLLRDIGAAIRAFIPDPTYSEQMNYPTTGANRVDTCQGVLIAALVEEDVDRVQECVAALPAAWEIVDRADGFYRDGSFIQHIDVPYTGSYGVELIRNVAPLLNLLEDTDLDIIDREPLWDLIDEAYLPVMVTGHMLDFVRGRAVARVSTNGSTSGRAVAAAVADLASTAPTERRAPWFSLLREWSASNPSLDLLAGPDLPGAVALAEVEDAPEAPVPPPRSAYFPSMDRLVHRTPDWTAAIAMCSNRVAAYEATEVENEWGSRTGNAMRYLFIDDDPAPFDDYFWSTLDYGRPPGTANHAIRHEPRPTRGSNHNRPPNEWTGGMVHDTISVAAMHQTGLDGDAPECRRLTIGTGDRLIELVSDITTRHNAFATIENRMFPDGTSPRLVLDDERVLDEAVVERPSWAHLEGVAGYVFLTGDEASAGVSTRVGSTVRVERAVDEIDRQDRVRRRWATLDLAPDDRAAAWMVLPGVSLSDARTEALTTEHPRVERNDAIGQIVSVDRSTTIAAAWRSLVIPLDSDLEIECPHPLLVLARRSEAGLLLRVTEPTQERKRSRLRVTGRWEIVELGAIDAEVVTAAPLDTMTEIIVNTDGRAGRSCIIALRKT